MTPNSGSFPWLFFWKIARLQAAVSAVALAVLAARDPAAAHTALPYFLLATALFLGGFALASRPLRRVLERVRSIVSVELPHQQQLSLFYQKDEWAPIAAALEDTDRKLQAQLRLVREENRKFTTLLSSISNEILAVDPQMNVLFHNQRFSRTFLAGREKLQEGGKIWSMLEVPEALELFRQVLGAPQTRKVKGFPVLVAGETRFYNLTVSPLPDGTGGHNGAVGVFADVTEAKLTEQMRVDFVANVSHEIRTPLTSVKGYAQALQGRKASIPEEMHGFLGKIVANTERMIALVNDLLRLSVIESQDRISPEEVSLGELLDHAEDGVRTLHPGRPFTLVRELEVGRLEVDPKLFERVLVNLVENAAKYGGDSPVVTVSSRPLAGGTELRVMDNGPGIAKEHLGRIFERFYRVDPSRVRDTGGTGLGLAIVKHIVAKHHGSIRAESDGARGTAFIIELPS